MSRSIAALALLLTTTASAGDRLPRELADKALSRLADGTLVVFWASHLKVRTPILCRVAKPVIAGEGDSSRIVLELTRLATSVERRDRRGFEFALVDRPEPSDAKIVDLAYVYVPSSEVPGAFVNLARLLDQPRPVGQVSVRVPADLLAAIGAPVGGEQKPAAGIAQALGGKFPPGTKVKLAGRVEVRGGILVVNDPLRGAYVIRLRDPAEREPLMRLVGQDTFVMGVVGAGGALEEAMLADAKSRWNQEGGQ